jgi:hypothetical protein
VFGHAATRAGAQEELWARCGRLADEGHAPTVLTMFRRRCIIEGCRARRFSYQQICDWHLGVERTAWREEGLPEPSPYEEEYRWAIRQLNQLLGRQKSRRR